MLVLLCLLVLLILAGESQLIGSLDPIIAVAGDDVILPCSLEPPIDTENLTVEWSRPDLNLKYVHYYRDGRNIHGRKYLSYRDRTMLFEGELVRGNVSLKLSRVKLEDEGSYTCRVGQVMTTVIQLSVVAVSKPEVSIVGAREDGMVLQCESGGWYPEPELEWRDSEGDLLPDAVTQTDRLPDPGPHQRYTVTSRVTVQKTDTNRFTCRVHLQGLNQTRKTEIHVPGDLFQMAESSSDIARNAALIGCAVVLAGLVLTVLVCYKKQTIPYSNAGIQFSTATKASSAAPPKEPEIRAAQQPAGEMCSPLMPDINQEEVHKHQEGREAEEHRTNLQQQLCVTDLCSTVPTEVVDLEAQEIITPPSHVLPQVKQKFLETLKMVMIDIISSSLMEKGEGERKEERIENMKNTSLSSMEHGHLGYAACQQEAT
ncbi:butyrophilin subfamily 1 member A1-like isoform X2 [Hypomesus transpacificus]|uniref:butyrophilin subfamily 1 member A1-like isoform X2 n=1 Tax=Hypomesus transpacificus TaxID=137520 RepID=UPI001F07C4BD|nr:butyrophilin subfamily 1 member A1-like isoform X2 [Hypomesus transpacificus]